MIDKDLIDSLEPAARESVMFALMGLASSGILELQKTRQLERLASGADDEDKHVVAERVLKYRRETHDLIRLQQLGQQYLTEMNHEST